MNKMTKICPGCKIEKDIYCYNKCKSKKDGLSVCCRDCQKIRRKISYNKNVNKNKLKEKTELKRCHYCNEIKSGSQFSINLSTKDGLDDRCKVCMSSRTKRIKDDKHAKLIEAGLIEAPQPIPLKRCEVCNEEKEINDFNKSSSIDDGISNNCKECAKIYQERASINAKMIVLSTDKRKMLSLPKAKVCAKCLLEKNSQEFSINSLIEDNLNYACKACLKAEKIENKKINTELFKQRNKSEAKKCTKCNEIKMVADFRIMRDRAGGIDTQCRECRNGYNRFRYHEIEDKKKRQQVSIDRKYQIIEIINNYKAQFSCAECGFKLDICCMDFAHLDKNDKFMGITEMCQYAYSVDEIMKEIKKTRILCIFCHKSETYDLTKNYDQMIAKSKKQKLIKLFWDERKGHCRDCNLRFHPFLMEFDHRDPEDKISSLAIMVRRGVSEEIFRKEMGKCDLVCCGCHRLRTKKLFADKSIFTKWRYDE